MSKNNVRKLKCTSQCISENEKSILHPLVVGLYEGQKNKNICTTNSIVKKDEFIQDCDKKKDNLTIDHLLTNIMLPNINIDTIDLLSLYDINNIDSLNNWIDENLYKLPFDNINRVLNIWIKSNLSELKQFNNALVNIIKKILEKFNLNINKKYLDTELPKFIDYWIKKSNENDFDFNLILDFKKFLNKKYGS